MLCRSPVPEVPGQGVDGGTRPPWGLNKSLNHSVNWSLSYSPYRTPASSSHWSLKRYRPCAKTALSSSSLSHGLVAHGKSVPGGSPGTPTTGKPMKLNPPCGQSSKWESCLCQNNPRVHRKG